MIKNLNIRNFKSLKTLDLDCGKVNIFIGKPNTGKSNILECLSFFSSFPLSGLRIGSMQNLFYDNQINEKIRLKLNETELTISETNGKYSVNVKPTGGGQYQNQILATNSTIFLNNFDQIIRLYKFGIISKSHNDNSNVLTPPYGDNLYRIIETNDKAYEFADDILKTYGFDLVLRDTTKEIEFVKRSGRKLISFPYSLLADTIRRMIFLNIAIMTNKKATLVFEEPESYAFPFYTKDLAETIATDEYENQYFITTHNPYFLKTIVDKTSHDNLRVFYTYYEDYQTRVKLINKESLVGFFLDPNVDVFLNIDKLLEPE